MTTWRPIATAPTDGTEIIGRGFPPDADENQLFYGPDVRIIKAWRIGETIGWSAKNGFYGFTVGFKPTQWIPIPLEVGDDTHENWRENNPKPLEPDGDVEG